jgi:chemotaxis protein CheX
LINPFLAAAETVFRQVTGHALTAGEPALSDAHMTSNDVTVLLGVAGAVHGHVVLSMDTPLALRVASAMMMGAPMQQFDELGKSAICELGNMITGNAMTALANLGYPCDTTPPSIVLGRGATITMQLKTMLSVPMAGPLGTFALMVALKEAQ